MRTIDGNALYSWLGDTMLPKCMIDRSKDAEDTVLEVMQRVREMKEADGYGPHMAPSDGTEPLGVMADKNKPHPRGQVNWTKDMENAGKNYLEWKQDMMKAMWSLYWFEESKKMRTDLSPDDVECCFDQLKRDAAVWIRMATQMDAGQRGKSGNLGFWGGDAERTFLNIIINVCHLALHNVFGEMPEYIDDDIRK